MLRAIAKVYARLSYLFETEAAAARMDINAASSRQNAELYRKSVETLNKDADAMDAQAKAIDESVKEVDEQEAARRLTPEFLALSKQDQYEDERAAKKERDEAVEMARNNRVQAEAKRELAKQHAEKAEETDKTTKALQDRADAERTFADKIRHL